MPDSRSEINHVLHIGLCILTGGLWLPIYGYILFSTGAKTHVSNGRPGSARRLERDQRRILGPHYRPPGFEEMKARIAKMQEVEATTGYRDPFLDKIDAPHPPR